MKLKEIKVEAINKETGFVLKRIITDEGEFHNRKLAVNNTIYVCEKQRVKLNKPLINSPFQTHHLRWDKKNEEWDLLGLKKAREHAEKNNRFFIPFHQKNQSQWAKLNWKTSKEEFLDLSTKTDIVPIYLPINCTLEEWTKNKEEALSKLSENQILMPVLSTKHNLKYFPLILSKEIKNSSFLGFACYSISNTTEKMNLNFMRALNRNLKEGDSSALMVCLNYPRVLWRLSHTAGSFAFACFGGDIFSHTATFPKNMSLEMFEKMDDLTPEELYFYDKIEKKWTKSNKQKQLHGFDVTNKLVNNLPVGEGLSFQQAIKYASHILQQDDLDLINKFIIDKKPMEIKIKDYVGWNVFWNTKVEAN